VFIPHYDLICTLPLEGIWTMAAMKHCQRTVIYCTPSSLPKRVAFPVAFVFLTRCRGESLATVATEPLAVLVDAGSASASEAGCVEI